MSMQFFHTINNRSSSSCMCVRVRTWLSSRQEVVQGRKLVHVEAVEGGGQYPITLASLCHANQDGCAADGGSCTYVIGVL